MDNKYIQGLASVLAFDSHLKFYLVKSMSLNDDYLRASRQHQIYKACLYTFSRLIV